MEAIKDLNILPLFQLNKKEVEEVYKSWKKALMTNDFRFLENLYTDDFTSFSAGGIIKNKSEVLTRLGFKDVRYLCWEDKSIVIDIKGENAILKSCQTLNIELYNLPMKIDREMLLTFRKHDGKWLLTNTKEISI